MFCRVEQIQSTGASFLKMPGLGGGEDDATYDVQPLHRNTEIRNTSKTLTFIDEDSSSIDDGHFLYSSRINGWLNIPGWRHQNGTVLVFADGHTEYWKWKSGLPSGTYFSGGGSGDPLEMQDMARLQQIANAGRPELHIDRTISPYNPREISFRYRLPANAH